MNAPSVAAVELAADSATPQSQIKTEFGLFVMELKEAHSLVLRGEEAKRRAVDIVNNFQKIFGDSKKELIRLAEAVGVDVSTLYRWRQEVERPRLDADVVPPTPRDALKFVRRQHKLELKAAELKLRAQRLIGQAMQQVNGTDLKTEIIPAVLREAPVSWLESKNWLHAASVPNDDFEAYVKDRKDREEAISVAGLLATQAQKAAKDEVRRLARLAVEGDKEAERILRNREFQRQAFKPSPASDVFDITFRYLSYFSSENNLGRLPDLLAHLNKGHALTADDAQTLRAVLTQLERISEQAEMYRQQLSGYLPRRQPCRTPEERSVSAEMESAR
jgi:hypothetical protein